MPPPSPGAPTLYDFYLDPNLEAWATLEDDDDGEDPPSCNIFEGTTFSTATYLRRRHPRLQYI